MNEPAALREAFARVLTELEIKPGDPAWTDGRDVVGAAYERLFAGHSRRRLGQFYTPLPIGRTMARWLLAANPALLLDPGCGSGSLLAAVAHERNGLQTRLLGLDVDPLAIAMARKNGAIRRIKSLDLRCANFLTDDLRERPQAILCNPPYTRHQALSAADKRMIHAGFTERLGIEFSQLASLHVLFLVRALEVADDEARLAFITPSHWLDMNYAREVKRIVLDRAWVDAIIELPAHELVFEHATTTATITLIRKGRERGQTRLLRASSTEHADIARQLNDPVAGRSVALSSSTKWSRPTRRRNAQGVLLHEVANVRRGVATGCNAFFVLSDQQRREHGLHRCSLRPCASSPRVITSNTIDETSMAALPDTAPRWLLLPSRARLGGPLERYLQLAKHMGVHNRYLVRQRVQAGRPWWQVETEFDAAILFSYLNREHPRFVYNRLRAVPLNNWLAIQPHEGISPEALIAALREPAVEQRLRDDARRYGKGLWKLEPAELKALRLPANRDALWSS